MTEDTELLDEALLSEAFASHAVPELSGDFERRVKREIDELARRKTQSRPLSLVMLCYWLFSCLMSLVVLASLGDADGDAKILIFGSVGFCFLVGEILLRYAGVNLAGLIVASIRRSEDSG